MRPVTLVLLLLTSLAVFAEPAIEVVPPAAINEDLTATWTVIVTNPDAQPTQPQLLYSAFGFSSAQATVVSAPPGCTIQEGGYVHCHDFVLAPGERRELAYTVRYAGRFGTLSAYVQLGNVLRNASVVFWREFPVTTVADDGSGSLRQAIVAMNERCAAAVEQCAIVFRIDGPVPVEGWFTIRPISPLPEVVARHVFIDGRSQTSHTGNTNPAGPELMIDGSLTWGHGLMLNGGDVIVTDLSIGNFLGNGIASDSDLSTRIERCHLGMDPSGTRRAPNELRGAEIHGGRITVADSLLAGNFRSGGWFESVSDVTIARNRFIGNGASGFYAKTPLSRLNWSEAKDNVISDNAHAGISLDRQSGGIYGANHFHGNLGRAIDIGIDGPTTAMVPGLPGQGGIVGMPTIVTARYENGQTIIQARIAPRSPHTYVGEKVFFYANTVPRDGGELIGSVDWTERHGDDFHTLRIPRDLRGQWVSASTFAIYIVNFDEPAPGSSETSEPRLVE